MSKHLSKPKMLLGTTLTAAVFLSGCGSDLDQFVATNTTNIIAPVAVNDAFNALGNATVNQAAAGVLANDAINGGSISSYDAVGNQGGTIVLNADGSFAYTPVFGFVGQETFAYTLSNNAGSSTATVTMTSTGSGFFVDNTAAPGGDGSQASPFNTLAAAVAAANSGDTIYVARGDGNNTGIPGGFTLPAGVKLIGEGTGLILAQTIEPAGTAPIISGPIVCEGDNVIQGFTIDGSTNEGVIIDTVSNVTVANNTFTNIPDRHIMCNDISGTVTVDHNIFSNVPTNGDDYVRMENSNTDGNFTFTFNTFTDANGDSYDDLVDAYAVGTSVVNMTLSNNTAIGSDPDDFGYGFNLGAEDTSQVTLVVDGNEFKNFDDYAMYFDCYNDAKGFGTVTGNMLSDITDSAIYAYVNDSTITISGNIVSNIDPSAGGGSIEVGCNDNGGTLILQNNQVSGSTSRSIYMDEGEVGDLNVALRDNTLTDSVQESIFMAWRGAGDLCVEVTGNTVNRDMYFDEDAAAGDYNVENYDDLEVFAVTGNTFNGGATVIDDPNVIDVDFCNIP